MTDKSARETIAEHLCDPQDIRARKNGKPCHGHYEEADAILTALEAGGFAVVPKEPPRWVLDMAHYQIEDCRGRGCDDVALHVWQFIRETAAASNPKEEGR